MTTTALYAIPLIAERITHRINNLETAGRAALSQALDWECFDHDPADPTGALHDELAHVLDKYEDNRSLVRAAFNAENELTHLESLIKHVATTAN